jgi:altronate hydrolase
MNQTIDKMKELSWNGYLRDDGSKGIRNKVLVVYTVECSHHVAKKIAENFNTDVDLVGFSGCTDNAYAVKMLLALARHPNVGAVLAIGLGCEYVQPGKIAEHAIEHGRLADHFYIQENGGTQKSIEKGIIIVNDFLKKLKDTKQVPMTVEDLVIGAECGGSDYTSGLAGNVVVGRLYDYIVDMKGTAIFEEIVEAVGLKSVLAKRASTEEVKEALEETYDKAMKYCKKVKQYSISPGNFVGGLTTIEEKSMGAIVKSGTKPINGVIKVSEKPCQKGLYLMDSVPDEHFMDFGITNPNDNEGIMDMITAGCQLVILVTGRGNVVGSAVSPILKITGNEDTYKKMKDDMDFCAASILKGQQSLEELTLELMEVIADICAGNLTKAEKLGHKEYFVPYKYQSHGKRC